MAIECDRYGFFNGIYGLEQSNWANYWRGIIPSGVLAQPEGTPDTATGLLAVFEPTQGAENKVYVKSGQAIVDNHRVWVNTDKALPVAQNSSGYPRIDLVVIRVTYGNTGESIAELDVKTGVPSANPVCPTPQMVTGGTYELPLAEVRVESTDGNNILQNSNITDRRYVYKLGNDSVTTFSGTTVTCLNDIEYRNDTAISSCVICLPANPNDTYITGVNFTSTNNFSSVTFKRGNNTYTDMKILGDSLNIPRKRYNLVIWWDSGYGYYWCAAKAI